MTYLSLGMVDGGEGRQGTKGDGEDSERLGNSGSDVSSLVVRTLYRMSGVAVTSENPRRTISRFCQRRATIFPYSPIPRDMLLCANVLR